jgi:hypothetical protein
LYFSATCWQRKQIVAAIIDAKNEKVAGWYAGFGAVPLLDAPLSLLLPLGTIAAALKTAGKQ